MSQSPFGSPYDLPDTVMPERTSVMAVLSLVLGIVCVPVFGILAIFLGVFALFGIKASRGRVSGTGLAVTGIILGVVMTLVWGTCIGGGAFIADMMTKQVAPSTGAVISAAQSDNIEGVKAGLSSSAQARITPEAVAAFNAALTTEMGAFKRTPDSIREMFQKWTDVFGAIGQSGGGAGGNPMQGYNNAMPIPIEFENGWAMAIVVIDQSGGPSGTPGALPIENIVMLTPSGAEIVLIPTGTILPSTPAPAPDSPTPDAPEGDGAAPSEPPADPPAGSGDDKSGGG